LSPGKNSAWHPFFEEVSMPKRRIAALLGIFGLFRRRIEDKVANAGEKAYEATISELNKSLGDKAAAEGIAKGTALAREAIARNHDYSVFTVSPGIGGF
jgi:hypothetical protein